MSEETCTVNLKPLSDKNDDGFKLQSWKRENLDLVNNWFTLYNEETKKYLTADEETSTLTKSKICI